METYSETRAAAAGVDVRFVQDNRSFSAEKGTVRGLHFQREPCPQAKLVQCVRGSIIDYAVDIRRGSPTYGKWVSQELSAENGLQLFIPVGFAHGFVTLEPNVEVAYKVSGAYTPECEGGIVWNDPDIGIDWPLPASGPVISVRDAALPFLAELESPFEYDGAPLEALIAP